MTAPGTTGGSRLRPSDRRLLMGYGPAVVIAGAFLLMALLVPTVAPEQNVSAGASGGSGSALGTNATGQSGAAGALGTGTSGKAGGTTGRQTHGGLGVASGVPGRGAQSGGGGGSGNAQAPGKVSGCGGAQVAGDPYSPPCVTFSGYNGGATSRGVTGSSITVSYRIPADNTASVQQAIQQIAGKYNASRFVDSSQSIIRTLNDLITYFNTRFQFYGRKLVLKSYNGQGQIGQELTDGGQAAAQADAIHVADTIGSFADVSALSQPYAESLAAQHVMNFGAPYMSQPWFQAHAPYSWSFFPNCSDLGDEVGSIAVKELLNQNVTWAGQGVQNGKPRKIAAVNPDNPVYVSCADQVISAIQASGHSIADRVTYTLDLSRLSQEASVMEQKIVNDGITTVICGCDPITLVYLTGDLKNAHYMPEFFNLGAAFTDVDLVSQLLSPDVWAHAAGITNNGQVPPYGGSIGYFAARAIDPNNPPAHIVDIIYEQLYMLALGIQGAGPDLTPQNFQTGMLNYRGGNGEYGPWTFNVNGAPSWTPQHEYRFEWWNPNAISPFDQSQGMWVAGSTFYTPANTPNGPPPVFPSGPQ